VRYCLLGSITGADSPACLLAAPQGKMREWNQPFRQEGEGPGSRSMRLQASVSGGPSRQP